MKVYTYGDRGKPVMVMLPGSFCPARALEYLYDRLQGEFHILVAEYSGHYEGSTFTTRKREARKLVRYLQREKITAVDLIYGQSMGAEIGIELMHQLIEGGIPVGHTFFDGAPCIHLSRPYRALMNLKFGELIRLMRDRSTEEVMRWRFLKVITNGDTESLRPMIEVFIEVAPFLTKESIRAETQCCYTFDFPHFSDEDQKKLFFFYAREEKAYKICYKALRRAYPHAVFRVISGYGHMTYSMRHTDEYVQLIREICV